jgi:hypothetical protein
LRHSDQSLLPAWAIVENSSYPRVHLNCSKLIQQLVSTSLIALPFHFKAKWKRLHVSWALWYFKTTYLQCNVLYYPKKQTMHYFGSRIYLHIVVGGSNIAPICKLFLSLWLGIS